MSDAYADRTIAAYRARAKDAIENWNRKWRPSRFLREFARGLPRRGRVLDYGCGIGLELAWLRRRGFTVEGVEGTLEFVTEARHRSPDAAIRHGRFETVPLGEARYHGIWCSAALIHVPPEVLAAQIRKLMRALLPGGLLAITLGWGRAKKFTRRDWIPGRYVAGYLKKEASFFFREWAVRSLKVVSKDGRKGRWIQILASASA